MPSPSVKYLGVRLDEYDHVVLSNLSLRLKLEAKRLALYVTQPLIL